MLRMNRNYKKERKKKKRSKCMILNQTPTMIVTGSQRKQVNVNFNLTQTNSWCINYNQILHKNHKLCILQIGRKSHWKC